MQSSFQPPDHPPGHPPFADGSAIRPNAAAPGWIMPVGIIGIVYASLGIVTNLCGSAWYLATPAFVEWVAGLTDTTIDDETMARVKSANSVLMMVGVPHALAAIGLGVALLVGSVRLVRRRSEARGPLLIWAVGRPILALLGAIAAIATFQQGMVIANAMDPTSAGSDQVAAIVMTAIGVVLTCIAPVAMLVLLFNQQTRSTIDRLGALPSSA